MNEQDQMDLFNELATDTSISTDQLDRMVTDMAFSKAEYEAQKKISSELHKKFEEKKAQLMSTLQAANKKKYHVDGIGTVSVSEKLKVKTPQFIENKKLLFDYITAKYGEEGLLSHAGINYQTLNSFYNTEFELAQVEGTADDFAIPGLDAPLTEHSLSFRK